MNITVDHIPKTTAHNRRPNKKMIPTSITVHSTGNASSNAKGERKWLENPSNTRTASWHYVVDEKDIIEAIPPNEVAYHAGTAAGNNTSISIEMCENGNRALVLKRTQELVKYLMDKHNVRIIKRHYDWSKKNCPRILNVDGKWGAWHIFLAEIFAPVKKAEKKVSGMKPNWADWQWKEAAATYQKAVEQGIFNSDEWVKKANAKNLTFDEIEFLNLALNGRLLK